MVRRLDAPGGGDGEGVRLPRIDERLAPPETRLEYLRGAELYAAPADPPHATRHADLAFVLRASVAEGFIAAVDLLTRTDEASDFAPDASIYPADPDREGHRQLEEVAFEVASEQALSVPTLKARELVRRGVRRLFCVLVKQSRVLEWNRATDGWQPLRDDDEIVDRVFVRPLAVRALLDATASDEAVARALLARRHPVLEAELLAREARGEARGEAQGEAKGLLEGRRAALEAVLRARKIELGPDALERFAAADMATLDRFIARAASARTLGDVLDEGGA